MELLQYSSTLGMPDSVYAQFDIVSNTYHPAPCCLNSDKVFLLPELGFKPGSSTWERIENRLYALECPKIMIIGIICYCKMSKDSDNKIYNSVNSARCKTLVKRPLIVISSLKKDSKIKFVISG